MTLLSLPLAVLLLYLAFALGSRLLRKFNFAGAQRVAFSTSLGLAFFSAGAFVLSAVHVLTLKAIWALLIVLGLWLLPDAVPNYEFLRRQLSSAWAFFKEQFRHRFSMVLSVLFLALLLLQFLSAFAPPTSAEPGPKEWDSLVYHFSVAKIYAAHHGFVFLDFPHANWPMAIELLHAVSMVMDSVILAKLLAFGVALLLLISIYAFARTWISQQASFVAVLIFFTIPVVGAFMGTGYVDLPLALIELLAFWSFLNWFKHESNDWLLLTAVFAGFAASIKTLGGFAIVLLGIGFLYKLATARKTKVFVHRLKATAFFALVSGIFFLPWYLKTFYWTGNPVWPLYRPFMAALGIDGTGTAFFNQTLANLSAGAGTGHGIVDFLLLPLSLTFKASVFNGVLSPLFLAFLPLLIFLRPLPENFKKLFAFAAGFLALWFVNFQDARFLFPILALLSIPAAYVYEKLRNQSLLGPALRLALLGMLAFCFIFMTVYKYQSLGVPLGFESEYEYLMRTQSNFGALDWANRNLPPQSKLFLFNDIQGYYSDLPYEYFVYWDYSTLPDADSYYAKLKALGITHLVYNNQNQLADNEIGYRQSSLTSALLKKHGTLVYSYNRVDVYELAD